MSNPLSNPDTLNLNPDWQCEDDLVRDHDQSALQDALEEFEGITQRQIDAIAGYGDARADEAATAALEQAAQLVDDAGKEWGDKARDRKSKTYSAYVIAALDLQGRIRALKSDAAIGDDKKDKS